MKRTTIHVALLCAVLSMLAVNGQSEEQMETVRKIRQNLQPTFGTWVYLKDPAVTEMLADAGLDWMIIDMEHGSMNEDQVERLVVPLKGTRCVSIVRIPEGIHPGTINKVLDTGAQGILVPMIRSRADAENAVRLAKYPPVGQRGIGYERAQGWGLKVDDYLKKANEAVMVGLIIETREALENIESITEVQGIDFILPGTFDLSGALGVLGRFDDPKVISAKKKIEEVCRRKKIPLISWALTREDLEIARRDGSTLIALAGDVDWIGQGVTSLLKLANDTFSPPSR